MLKKLREWLGKDADALEGLQGKSLEIMIKELTKQQQALEQATLRLALIGQTGSGKSSLINAIIGQPVARTGIVSTDHAREGEVHKYKNVEFVDLPGSGGVNHPAATYVQDLKLLEPGRYDGFILVTANRLTENDVTLFRELHIKQRRPLFVVRTHFDLAVQTHTEAAARREIEAEFRQHLGLAADQRVYMVASPYPQQYDLPRLILDIVAALPNFKQIKLLEAVPAYTEELLQKKRAAVEKIVLMQASLAAANGLNPIPGLNIALDIGLMVNMTRDVISAFGLTREQLNTLAQLPGIGMTLDQMLDTSSRIAGRLARNGVIDLLKLSATEAGEETAEQAAKGLLKYGARYAPVIGSLLSAGISFTTAYIYGKHLLNDCEETTRQILLASGND